MSLKFKISLLHIAVSFVTLFFIYMIYDSYIISQQKDIEKQLTRVLKLNQTHMEKSLKEINRLLDSKKELTKEIHLNLQNQLKNNPNLKLDYLREQIKKEFDLVNQNLDIEIFLVNKFYKIIDSTHKKNISFDLKSNKKSKLSLDNLIKIDDYNRSTDVAVDFLDYEMKSFSYSKLSEKFYLGLGLIYKDSINQKEAFDEMREIANVDMDMYIILEDSKKNQYFESLIAHKKSFKSNQEYMKSKKLFSLEEETTNPIINTARIWDIQNIKKDNSLQVFIPLMKKNNPFMSIPGDVILKIELDISEENLFFDTILNKLILFILIHFLLIFLIYYFTTKYQRIEKEINLQILKNNELVIYNKNFIANMVHQIRTPFAVIMTNISILEMLIGKNIQKYTTQINASINLLTNSYENLSYFISSSSLNYKKRRINLSNFIIERVNFFDQIANANNKNIIINIDNDIFIYINDIELERFIDNNISFAIKKCSFDSSILISLNKKLNTYNLTFKIFSKDNKEKTLFDIKKEEAIKDTSSSGLGIYIIKEICLNNNISFDYENTNNNLSINYNWS